MVSQIKYQQLFAQIQQATLANRTRSLFIFVGENEWLEQQTNTMINESLPDALFFSFEPKFSKFSDITYVHNKTYRQYLGTEQKHIIFAVNDTFNVDAFAALSGTLIAGGQCVLLLSKSQFKNSPFSQRLMTFCDKFEQIYRVEQSDKKLPLIQAYTPVVTESLDTNKSQLNFGCITKEQESAVDKIINVVNGHRDRPLVITADRGRGKSSAMAIAASEILKQGNKNIIITAPHPDAVNIFFKQLQVSLPEAIKTGRVIRYQNSEVQFLPLDLIIKQQPICHLLLVDEAAGIPLPILKSLSKNYHRQVFVSTIHGYEGAGRGFSGKFLKMLKESRPSGQHFHINEPIRWAINDPLEQFTFASLLLNSELPKAKYNAREAIQYQVLSSKDLVKNEVLLNQVFSLLVTAHYQTKPSDLKMLLDDPSISVIIQQQNKQILAVALLLAEGEVTSKLANKVKQSLRRLKGHFIPQSLLVHCGIEDAFNYRFQRVVRIAVHPEVQDQGLGTKLLNYCASDSKNRGFDFIGSSFGANQQLLSYWFRCQFNIARIGFSKDAASGEHSALVIKPLTEQAEPLSKQLKLQFFRDLHYYKSDEYKYLDTQLMSEIFAHADNLSIPSKQDLQALADFAQGNRVFSCCAPAIKRCLIGYLVVNTDEVQAERLGLAIALRKVIQQQSFAEICEEFQLTGKKAVLKLLQQFCTHLLNQLTPK
ncbi:GNAT family N-acetyltransferase [Thalassotalea psychrophila]|uniref:tRNA(Met) cytidine acetyltransferase TmcA n=1 Tax=Thalassotalea psychrophila TaxID=3065647 RepID=A0ABY9TRR7_9GAMM|nr:GNAT family N-acetyltransferase [Colwelliaceae bacterium SQ149]